MATDSDSSAELCEQVTQAYHDRRPLRIQCGDSKAFYGRAVAGEALSLKHHTGIVDYQPSELVITLRSGTRLVDVEQILARNNQRLAFEPPRHSLYSSIGGVVACALSGPARAFHGAARDHVLGAHIINGKGEALQFGGQVMKNVAGYDVSRLMVGAQGTLGVLLQLSIKVLPIAEREETRVLEADIDRAHDMLHDFVQEGCPVSASGYFDGRLYVRLSGTANSVTRSAERIGGEHGDAALWDRLRDQQHAVFQAGDLWRLSVPSNAPFHHDDRLVEWGGTLRWRYSPSALHEEAAAMHGHATRYAISGDGETGFQPLPPGMMALQRRIRESFDPAHILNPGRLYPEL